MAKRRLAILRHAEEITGNVALTCRYYGISRQIFSTWKRRYNAHGLDGLRDRSHRPQVSPNATRAWSKSSLPSQLRTARVVADIFKPAAARARLPAGGGSMTFATPARACSSPRARASRRSRSSSAMPGRR
jgi:transposase-like protein